MEAAQNCYAEGLRSSAWHFALEMKISPGLQRLSNESSGDPQNER